MGVFAGRAQLEIGDVSIEVDVTLYTRVEGASGRVVWDGYFTATDQAGAWAVLEAQQASADLVALRLRGVPGTSAVRITELVDVYGDLEGLGQPPTWLRAG